MPGSYRDNFHVVLEEIPETYSKELAEFDGDSESLQNVGLTLDDCLIEPEREQEKHSPVLFWVLAPVALVLLLVLFFY